MKRIIFLSPRRKARQEKPLRSLRLGESHDYYLIHAKNVDHSKIPNAFAEKP